MTTNEPRADRCPCCGSDEIEAGSVDVQSYRAFQEDAVCLDCGAEWEIEFICDGHRIIKAGAKT